MTKSIAFFNNKGGVGKTTLVCNFGAHLAQRRGLSVVVVDCDPQANATQLLLSDSAWESIYEDRENAERQSVLRVLRLIRAGDSGISNDYVLHEAPKFGVRVLAGHPSLSVIEDLLSTSWSDYAAGVLGGARRSLWARELTQSLDADVVLFDLGPSLGALNRSVLMGCDNFVTPVAADLFSLYALENIGDWLRQWLDEYRQNYQRLLKKETQTREFDIPSELPIGRGWAGYSVQQYVSKTTGGKIRQIEAYDRYTREIPAKAAQLDEMQTPHMTFKELGVVPNMFSMVPLAQNAHAPIARLTTQDGVRGAQVTQQARYVKQLDEMFTKLTTNLSLDVR